MRKSALIAQIDFGWLLAIVLFTMFAIALANMHKPTPVTPPTMNSMGGLQVMVIWPDERCVDVDLWFRAPGDQVVGFSQKDGRVANLLRDDTGCSNDVSGKNFEIIQTHGLPDGEYDINIHYYLSDGKPVPVHVVAQLRKNKDAGLEPVLDETVTLEHPKQQITVARVTIQDGKVISTNKLPVDLIGEAGH